MLTGKLRDSVFQFHKGTIKTKVYQDFYRNPYISIP